jgi:hypothetical protein
VKKSQMLYNEIERRIILFMEGQSKIYWHEPFFEGLQLDLWQYKDALQFESERPLSKEALIIDVVVIKKKKDVEIKNAIGRIFRKHNIIEYKSEKDSLSLQDYDKVMGYARLYSSFEDVPLNEMTVTFALTIYPKDLIKALEKERELRVQSVESGVYYVKGDTYPVQILESKKLSQENLFLRNLRSDLGTEDVLEIAQAYERLKAFEKKNVYLDRLIQANVIVFMEVMNVSDAVKELFFEAAENNGWLQERDNKTLREVAIKLLSLGDSVEKVATATGLPINKVEGLLEYASVR